MQDNVGMGGSERNLHALKCMNLYVIWILIFPTSGLYCWKKWNWCKFSLAPFSVWITNGNCKYTTWNFCLQPNSSSWRKDLLWASANFGEFLWSILYKVCMHLLQISYRLSLHLYCEISRWQPVPMGNLAVIYARWCGFGFSGKTTSENYLQNVYFKSIYTFITFIN